MNRTNLTHKKTHTNPTVYDVYFTQNVSTEIERIAQRNITFKVFISMEKNKVIMENGKPRVVLNEAASAIGGVSIEEAKILAFQVAQKIMHGK